MSKNFWMTLFLSILPGTNHWYLGRKKAGWLYLTFFLAPFLAGIGFSFLVNDDDPMILAIGSILVFIISGVDAILYWRKQKKMPLSLESTTEKAEYVNSYSLLFWLCSLIPGIGHVYLGLPKRGFSYLVGYIGITTHLLFLIDHLHSSIFSMLIFAIPLGWGYILFEAIGYRSKKEQGEDILDQTIMEQWIPSSPHVEKTTSTLLFSLIPGLGHLYLGWKQKGMLLLASYCFSFYFMNQLHFSIFSYVSPLLWIYSFFDIFHLLKGGSTPKEESAEHLLSWIRQHSFWISVGAIIIAGYYWATTAGYQIAGHFLFHGDLPYSYQEVIQNTLVTGIILVLAVVLLLHKKKQK